MSAVTGNPKILRKMLSEQISGSPLCRARLSGVGDGANIAAVLERDLLAEGFNVVRAGQPSMAKRPELPIARSGGARFAVRLSLA